MSTSQIASDKIAITELIHRYQLYIDSHDAELWASTFTADGVYDSPMGLARGTAELKEAISGWHSSGATEGKRHMLGLVVIDVDGDTASATSYYWIAEVATTPGVVATGTYVDRLRKLDGEWKLAHRKQTIDPSFKMPS